MCCNWCLPQLASTQTLWGTASIFLENTFQGATSNRVWNASTMHISQQRLAGFKGSNFKHTKVWIFIS